MAKSRTVCHAEAADQQRTGADIAMLLEATGVGTFSYDGATNTFFLDRVCLEMFDLAEEEGLSMESMRSRIHPDDLPGYWTAVAESMKNGNFSHSYRIVRRDGTVRFINGRGHSNPGMPGIAPSIRGICIDVTDRVQLETRLRNTESRMQELADGVPGLFSFIDRDYHVVFMSSQYRRIFDRHEGELVNEHIADIIGQEAFDKRKARYDAALAGETVQHEASRTMPDGREAYFTITHLPHRDEKGQIQGVLSLAIDITERRQVEEALERKSSELARSNKDLEQFAYVASHDLKAPLRAIEVLVQWLREDLRDFDSGEVQENLDLLGARTQRLNRLLDDLLEYSRAGRRVGRQRMVDTREMVEDIVTLLSPPEGMQVQADESLPEICAHHAPLEQVLRNLISNAIKHHPNQKGIVKVSAVDQGESVLFAVEDDGTGIPEEYAEKVFQMFQTLQPRDEREGSGMGLAIVKRIIDWQQGRIWFHAAPGGKGTVFKFVWNKSPDVPEASDESTNKEQDHVRGNQEAHQHSAG